MGQRSAGAYTKGRKTYDTKAMGDEEARQKQINRRETSRVTHTQTGKSKFNYLRSGCCSGLFDCNYPPGLRWRERRRGHFFKFKCFDDDIATREKLFDVLFGYSSDTKSFFFSAHPARPSSLGEESFGRLIYGRRRVKTWIDNTGNKECPSCVVRFRECELTGDRKGGGGGRDMTKWN